MRRTLAIASVILAVAFISSLTMDVGPSLREYAERGGTAYLKRSMHIGYLGVRLWDGAYVVRDLTIDGRTPTSRPWLTAKEIKVKMQWRPLVANREVMLEAIEMTDWKMYVEQGADGSHSFPSFRRDGGGPKRVTTTLKYVRARRGEFAYDDRGTPWSVVARNIDVTVAKPATEYRGSASFSDGLVSIQEYLPFRADMDTTFKINDGRVIFDVINLTTDGAKSVLKGDVNMSHWPEQRYSVKSQIDLPRMRQIFFADDNFELAVNAEFDGTFHLFKGEVRPDGKTSGGRELKGKFRAPRMAVNDYQFDDVAGSVRWAPRSLEVHDASGRLYGGRADFEYSMAPLGLGVKPTNTFDATYTNVDLTQLADFFAMQGLRLAGRASGTNRIVWPSGRFGDRDWTGEVRSAVGDDADDAGDAGRGITGARPAEPEARRVQPAPAEGTGADWWSHFVFARARMDRDRAEPDCDPDHVRGGRGAHGVRRTLPHAVPCQQLGLAGQRPPVCRHADGVRQPHQGDSR